MTAILTRLAYASAPASACVAGGSASGGVRTVLRLEGAAAFATAIALYGGAGFSWLAFGALYVGVRTRGFRKALRSPNAEEFI